MSTVPATEYPKLRALDVRPHQQNGQSYFLLRDPLQLSENSLLIPQLWGVVLASMDGKTPVDKAVDEFRRRYGVPIDRDDVSELVNALDASYLLENEHAHAAQQRILDAYRAEPFRRPLLAGSGYPESAKALRDLLDSHLSASAESSPRGDLVDAISAGRFGLLSPHIDYARGAPIYAQLWQQAAEAVRAADLVILVGTDHYGNDPFTLTRQHYATPYGTLPTNLDIVDDIAAAVGQDAAYAGELRHRGEHSLELVAVWLHHMRGGEPVEMVPMLVGSMYTYVMNGASPETDARTNAVLHAVRSASTGRRVAVIASGDLSHVGSAFGGAPLTGEMRRNVRADDDDVIHQMQRASASGFFESIRRVRDRNNVCGVAPIYLALRLLNADRGELHGYASCPADATDSSAVTICGMVWH
ncbi:MAG: AmmeMemoRadiSam system protein B [Caldilineaceae bacterium]